MINQRLRRQVMSQAVERLNLERREETVIGNRLPRIADYHKQHVETYTNVPEMRKLLESPQFSDIHLTQKVNSNDGSHNTIQEYLSNIRTTDGQIGNRPNREMLSEYIRVNYDDNYDIIRRTGEIIQNPEQATDEVLDELGHSLIQTYSAIGNENGEQAFSWYYQQIPFPPHQAIRNLQDSQTNVLNVAQEAQQRVLNAAAYREERIAEIAENLNNSLNKGFVNNILNKIDPSGIIEVLTTHQTVIGGGAVLAFSGAATYAYKNPELIRVIADRFIKPLAIDNSVGTSMRENVDIYRSVAQIQKEVEQTYSNDDVKGLFEKLFDQFYINVKAYFFKR